MPASPRAFTVTYGGFLVGDTDARRITTPYRIERDFERFSVEFEFVIRQATAILFAAEVGLVEEAFREPRGNLTIVMNGQTQYNFSHALGTGFNAQPRILKNGDPTDTGTMRTYRVRIEVELPADNLVTTSGARGLQESTVDVAFTPARRRTITIAGTYTASTAAATARAQYDSQIALYAAAVLAAIDSTATFELAEEPQTDVDDTDHTVASRFGFGKVIRFRRVYEEIIFAESTSALNDPEIIKQEWRVERRKQSPGDSPGTRRLVELTGTYSAWIDATATKDIRGKWDTIRLYLISQLKIQGGTSGDTSRLAIVDLRPTFDYPENRITAVFVALAAETSGFPFESRITTEDFLTDGRVLLPIWTGNPLARYVYQGHQTKTRTVIQTGTFPGAGEFAVPPTPNMAIQRSTRQRSTPLQLGLDGTPETILVNEVERTTVFEFFEEVGTTVPGPFDPGRTIVVGPPVRL